jgi:hypothetical protein
MIIRDSLILMLMEREDILLADYNDHSKRYIAYIRPSENPTFVESITNGFDKVTTFEYLPYTNNKVWLPGSGNDPVNDYIRNQATHNGHL